MEQVMVAASFIAGIAVFFAGIAVCVRFDQQGKTRRRTLEHAERMKALELGLRPDDAGVARYRALGAVGVAVPIASLSAAVVGSLIALQLRPSEVRFLALIAVWLVCGAVCLCVLPVVAVRLRERRPRSAMEEEFGEPRERVKHIDD